MANNWGAYPLVIQASRVIITPSHNLKIHQAVFSLLVLCWAPHELWYNTYLHSSCWYLPNCTHSIHADTHIWNYMNDCTYMYQIPIYPHTIIPIPSWCHTCETTWITVRTCTCPDPHLPHFSVLGVMKSTIIQPVPYGFVVSETRIGSKDLFLKMLPETREWRCWRGYTILYLSRWNDVTMYVEPQSGCVYNTQQWAFLCTNTEQHNKVFPKHLWPSMECLNFCVSKSIPVLMYMPCYQLNTYSWVSL